jgi:hypothetical protein
LTLIEVLGNVFREGIILVTTVKKKGIRSRSCGDYPTGIAATIRDTLFLLFVIGNVIRTYRHAMWRDTKVHERLDGRELLDLSGERPP